jgi:menaquinone-dependent protoporphyrinogen oxidase
VHELVRRTGWAPEIVVTLGGAEPYTKYGFFTRIVMRSIAKKHGRIVDVHRDYEFTDWDAVDRFARDFIEYASAKRKSA